VDHVDAILEQWRKERSDLDVTPMATTGRINRLSGLFVREMEKTWKQYGLHHAAFDVLATLRRAGPPYALSPGELLAATMVTSGTMTNRIDQLEKAGLVVRAPSAEDKRSFQVRLSAKGRALIDQAVEDHVQTLHRLTGTISKKELAVLNGLLRKMLVSFEPGRGATRPAIAARGTSKKRQPDTTA
jgi:DNA-binding MarR family transcriptional regulator